MNTIWAVDDFTHTNGATTIWSASRQHPVSATALVSLLLCLCRHFLDSAALLSLLLCLCGGVQFHSDLNMTVAGAHAVRLPTTTHA